MALQKIREFPGLTKLAPEAIESHETEQAIRDETHAFEMHLFDLRAEFIHREQKLRTAYLAKIQEIAAEASK